MTPRHEEKSEHDEKAERPPVAKIEEPPPFRPIVYTDEELAAMQATRTILVEEHGIAKDRIGKCALAVTTINCKCRPEDAAAKHKKFLETLELFDIPFLDDDDDSIPFKRDIGHRMEAAYAACGTDHEGRRIFWIRGVADPIERDEEKDVIEAGLMFYMALHADAVSLREGVTFVIDTSVRPSKKVGNEAKLQKMYQAYPLRPQAILIAGSSFATRVVVNGLIKIASVFTKQKILDRIKFVTLEEAVKAIPLHSAPRYLGGGGGGVDSLVDWVEERLARFPVPEI